MGLKKILDKSDLPILIKSLFGEPEFEKLISPKNQIDSYNVMAIGRIVKPNEWKKFLKLLEGHELNEMRVHGSYYGLCTKSFSVQLFGYLYYKRHWGKWMNFCGDWKSDNDRENNLIKKHEHDGDFVKSRIRLRTVLSKSGEELVSVRPNSVLDLPFGNITYQLTDSETKIYPA